MKPSAKPGISKPEGGVRFPAGKQANQTSRPDGDGLDGRGGSKNGKDSAAVEETRRSDSQPKNWKRKLGSQHSDAKAQKREC